MSYPSAVAERHLPQLAGSSGSDGTAQPTRDRSPTSDYSCPIRTPLIAAFCVALLVVRVFGQGKPEDVDPSLREAIAAWAAAISTGDESSISGYALDDAVFVSPSGVALTKQERLDMLRNAGARGATPLSSAHRYQIFGNTVVHTYRQDGMNPQGVIVPTRQLQVWVKQDEGWRVATSQATYVADR